MKLKPIYLFFYLCVASQMLFAQTTFTTVVSKNKLGVNERFRIVFSINKQGADHFTPPNFNDFRVVGGPSQSVNQAWINGETSFKQSYTYFLEPKNMGSFTIPGASIVLGGKTLKSNAVTITVLKAVDVPKDPKDPNYIAEQSVHLVAQISKNNPYVGEGIYVEYRLYVSQNISVNDFTVTDTPTYNGFWNQDIKINNLEIKMGRYNGEMYRYVVLKKALLIPTKSGKLSIDPMKMNILIGVPTGRGDFFGNAITRNVRKEFASPKKTVDVKMLPTTNKPANFNGAVGDFDFSVTASRNDLKANESSQIRIAVTGKGNLKLFSIPKIEAPKELEIYTPEHKENIQTTLEGLHGSISDTYTVVPQFKGKYKIPKVTFSYFNPATKKYKTISSDDLYVTVLEGKEIVSSPSTSKKDIVISGTNFKYIQTESSFSPKETLNFFQSTLFYLLLLLPLLAIPIGIIIYTIQQKRAGDVLGNKLRKADRLARKYLSEAQKQLGKKEAFYIALEKALHNFLKAKLQIETVDISQEKITQILLNKKVSQESVTEFISVLNSCDFARYTPTTDVMMTEEFEKAKAVIIQLDKQL